MAQVVREVIGVGLLLGVSALPAAAQSMALPAADPVGIARSGAQVAYGSCLEAAATNPALLASLKENTVIESLKTHIEDWKLLLSRVNRCLQVMAVPLMVRSIRIALEAVDPRLEAAARVLGAGRWHCFRTITLPLAMPGVLAALVLGFARALGEFGATITFVASIPGETETLPLAIYAALQLPGGEAMVTRLALLSVALALAALVASEWLARRVGAGWWGAGRAGQRGAHVL